MKFAVRILVVLGLSGVFATAQITRFEHVIIVFQENRTPDNLFQGLCKAPYGTASSCNTKPTGSQYNIQTKNWLDKHSTTGVTQPTAVALANSYDVGHNHKDFTSMCDLDSNTGKCKMDGAGDVACSVKANCPTKPQFKYVDNSTGILNPYLDLARQYGFANYMFQTNQGPSYPAHQYIFGGTSAPSAEDDAGGTFASTNVNQPAQTGTAITGCIALAGSTVKLITPTSNETQKIYPCFEHQTLTDLLENVGVTWKYYAQNTNDLWTAPNAIQHICVPNAPAGGKCTGQDWNNVVSGSSKILTDISACKLAQVSWSIPASKNSDHASSNSGGGPSWVASIVNAIGNNPKCANGEQYWKNTAILITWDDWGGWYDHEPPTILSQQPQGDYEYGFRVPLIVVSAYTPARFVSNKRLDFGSMIRFVEQNYGIQQGSLNFADARTSTNLTEFFNLSLAPRAFKAIKAALDANYFIHEIVPATDPDDY
jgi:phospholipase C